MSALLSETSPFTDIFGAEEDGVCLLYSDDDVTLPYVELKSSANGWTAFVNGIQIHHQKLRDLITEVEHIVKPG